LPGSVINGGMGNTGAATVNTQGTINGNIVNNNATVFNAQGTINGDIVNNNTSVFTVTGNLAGNSHNSFSINDTAQLAVTGGNFTGMREVDNGSTNANGIVVATGRTLSAGSINNGGFIQNSGTLTVTGFLSNFGTLNNLLSTSIINGVGVSNVSGTTTNAGTINGFVNVLGGTVFNSGTVVKGVDVFGAGTYTQTAGTTSGGLTNNNIVNANGGAFNGIVNNNAGGTFNVGGTVTGDFTFNNFAATSRLLVNSGSYTVAGLVTNSGTNAAGGIAVAAGATLNANGGITNNAGATIVNNGTVNDTLNNAGIVTNNLTYNANVATNTGTITNSATGTWTGNVIGNAGNTTGITNNGVWSGNVQANTGTVTNNLLWSGTVSTGGRFNNTANGVVAGLLTNTAGTTTNDGTLNGATVSGGTLTGQGLINGVTTVAGGGTFAPGSATPGTSTPLTGSLALQSGAFYLVQINPATSSLANVTGTATLSGATVMADFTNGSYVKKQYLILHTTAGVTGAFDPTVVNTNLPVNFGTSLSYSATDVSLNLTAALGAQQSLPANQRNVANAINNFFNNGGGALPPGFAALFGLTGSNLSSALSQGSGETATGSQQTTFDAMNLFMGVMTDPFIDGRGAPVAPPSGAAPYAEEEPLAYASRKRTSAERDAYAMFTKAPLAKTYDPRWSVWAAGFGGSQTTSGSATLGSNDTSSRLGAVAVGADYRFSPNTIAGVALAGGGTSFSVANGGTGRSDLFQAGAFVRHTVGPAYFTAALAYGWQDITTDRTVTIAGVDRLRAQFNANAWSGRVEGGYRFVTPWMGVTPYAAAQFTTFELPAYAESVVSGANTFALAYGAKSVTASRSEIGLRTDKSWAMPDSVFTLRGRFAWAHDYNTDRAIGATFQTLPGASFVVNGAAQSPDKALTTASAEVKWRSGVSLAATFEGEFSGNSSSYAGKGVARYQW
jgi:fibronectin-binding autotransporter adhesin